MNDLSKRPGRELIVQGKNWKWQLGRTNVVAYCENGTKLVAPAWTVKGVSPDVYERGRWKRNSDASVLPSDVVKWIENLPMKENVP